MATDAYLLPAYAAGDEIDVEDLTETDRKITQGSYTPTLTATGGTPALGADGFLTGKYHRTGLQIAGWVDLLISGAGASIVGTSWRISLPFNADLTLHTAGILDATSTALGLARSRSATAAQSNNFSVLLSAVKEMIFYGPASNSSLGSGDFTTNARLHIDFEYIADAAAFS